MNRGAHTVLYPVSDLASAKAIFSALLGVAPMADEPYYVGFAVAGQHIGLDPNGAGRGMTGATPFWEVDDIADVVSALEAAGAVVVEGAHDVGKGRLIAMLKDGDGNMIGLSQTP
jgi:predicted enzyme related to lactoylglutathione lyase